MSVLVSVSAMLCCVALYYSAAKETARIMPCRTQWKRHLAGFVLSIVMVFGARSPRQTGRSSCSHHAPSERCRENRFRDI